jgi:arabinofuranan 3-O-arabinosyltransferase
VVVVPQNFNDGWRATTSGTVLQPIRVNGWMQGWVLPAGKSGEVVAEFAPDTTYRQALAVGAVMLMVLVALAGVTRGRREVPAAPVSPGPAVGASILAGGGFVVAGPLGAVTAVGLAVITRRRWVPRGVEAVVPVVAMLGAAGVVVRHPWPGGQSNVHSWLVQGLTVLAVLSSVAQGLYASRSPYRARSRTKVGTFSRRRPRRIKGRSIP